MTHTTKLTRAFRYTRLLLHILSGLAQAAIYPHLSQAAQRRMAKNWSAGLLAVLNVKMRLSGTPPDAGMRQVMLAANHVSWLDVYALNSICPARFVAKSEIRGWPVFGWLSRNAGTLFIERAKRSDTARINQSISTVLTQGDRVTVFPEGTTSNGTMLRHFHASLLQPAVISEAMLCPVAICYRNADGNISKEAAYVEISLLDSLRRILLQPWITVELTFTDPINSSGKNRRELARLAEQAIASVLSLPVPHKAPGKSADPAAE